MTIRYKFYGGFTDNDSRGKDATYIYSQNINTTNSEYIQVSPKAKTMTELGADEIDFLVPSFAENLNNFFYVKDDKVYDKDKRLIYNHSQGQTYQANSLTGVIYLKDYEMLLYGSNPKDGNRSSGNNFLMGAYYDGDNIIQTSQYSKNMGSYNMNGPQRCLFKYNGRFNFTRNAQVYSLEIAVFNTSGIKVNIGEQIRGVTTYGQGLKLITHNGFMMLWDGVTDDGGIQDRYELALNLNNSVNLEGVDYVFGVDGLYYLNGVIPQVIAYKKASQYINFNKFDFLNLRKMGFVKVNNFIYSITKTDEGCDINVLGKGGVGLPIQFSSIYSIPNCKNVIQMQVVNMGQAEIEGGDPNGLVIFYEKKTGGYAIDFYSIEDGVYEELNDTGYIITKEYEGESLIFTKYARELKLYCDQLKDNESLKIEASINGQPFFEVKTLTKNDRWKNGYYSILDFKREFHKIVFKLTLNGHFKLYDFVFYDNIKTT